MKGETVLPFYMTELQMKWEMTSPRCLRRTFFLNLEFSKSVLWVTVQLPTVITL